MSKFVEFMLKAHEEELKRIDKQKFAFEMMEAFFKAYKKKVEYETALDYASK